MGQKIAFATSHVDLTPKPDNFKINETHYLAGFAPAHGGRYWASSSGSTAYPSHNQRDGSDAEWKKQILEQNGLFSGFPKFSPNGELWDGTTEDDSSYVANATSAAIANFFSYLNVVYTEGAEGGVPVVDTTATTAQNVPNKKMKKNDPESILVGDGTDYVGPFTLQEAADICWRVKNWKTTGFDAQGSTVIRWGYESGGFSAGGREEEQENGRVGGDTEEKDIILGSSARGLAKIKNLYPNLGAISEIAAYTTACSLRYVDEDGTWIYVPSFSGELGYRIYGQCDCDDDFGYPYFSSIPNPCQGEDIGAYFDYSFDFNRPVVSLKNDPSKYYIAFSCFAGSASYADLVHGAYGGLMSYSYSTDWKEISLISKKPLGGILINGSLTTFEGSASSRGGSSSATGYSQNEYFSANYSITPVQRTINLKMPGQHGRLIPVKMYGYLRTSSKTQETEGSISAPACSVLDSPLTLEPDKYWEYDDGNGNPIWDKDTGDMLRDPLTGQPV
jgi:hypothetical protein